MNHSSLTRRILPMVLATALLCSLAIPAYALLAPTPEVISVSDFSKNTTIGNVITFSPEDFRVDGADTLDAIRLSALPVPEAGILTLSGEPITVGTLVTAGALSGLQFAPLVTPTIASAEFSFTPIFASGEIGAEVSVGLYLLTAENRAPIAEDMNLCTFKNVALTERFSATDPEGDLLVFQLTKKPARGAVTISDTDPGAFVYTPYENKTGKDSFTFVAVDTVGNVSPPATVTMKIEKPRTKVTYADMSGNPAYNAALTLAEKGVLVGECMDGVYYFNADLPVTRNQFVTMAMGAMGIAPLEEVTITGFFDDTVIPTWSKGYVSSALKAGIVQGYPDGSGQVVFCPSNPITRAEAAVLLNRMLAVTNVDAADASYTDVASVPTWALQSAVNLETAGVLRTDGDGSLCLSETLTRGAAAQLLASALAVADARADTGFFHW